ncbi:hypothetical protein KDL01_25565 [Actinospica durhamensis]|uniref:Uncharacterized protein n=1 Tax=Actinospica durhamensis TaxID=1508375 RepID=A0A941EZ07_9ACTN|nr:DUF5819 family protein [Actinospica durhamensis]MBR7836674.1 hypothetical protein [Actinospica durhamensis]
MLATAGAAAVHLTATFFYNAPSNVVSQRYHAQINWWMNPLLTQNWQLFAPNPLSENVEIDARASVGTSAALTGWVDLSADDQAASTHDPAPSHLTMNALRNAWMEYTGTHTYAGQPDAPLAATSEAYLRSLVLGYLRPHVSGSIDSLQVRFVVTLVPGDGRTAQQLAAQTQTLPWWVMNS